LLFPALHLYGQKDLIQSFAFENISFAIYFHFVDVTCFPNILVKYDMDYSTLLPSSAVIMVPLLFPPPVIISKLLYDNKLSSYRTSGF